MNRPPPSLSCNCWIAASWENFIQLSLVEDNLSHNKKTHCRASLAKITYSSNRRVVIFRTVYSQFSTENVFLNFNKQICFKYKVHQQQQQQLEGNNKPKKHFPNMKNCTNWAQLDSWCFIDVLTARWTCKIFFTKLFWKNLQSWIEYASFLSVETFHYKKTIVSCCLLNDKDKDNWCRRKGGAGEVINFVYLIVFPSRSTGSLWCYVGFS